MATTSLSKIAVFDADGHIFENERKIFKHLPGIFRDQEALLASSLFPPMDSWNRTALSIAGRYKEGMTSETFRRANFEITAKEWREFLAAADIDGPVLYPTSALGFARVREVEWGIALARAYNDWLYHEFTRDNANIHAVALLPVQDPQAAAAELRRAVGELGFVGGIVIAGHRRLPLGDRFYDPIYTAAEELNTALAVHAGGPGDRFEMLNAIESRCVGHPSSLIIEMTSMMFGGVFDRFPKARFSFMEGGIAWALFLRERMHEAYEQWSIQAPELKCDPDEHLASGRIFFHCEADERIIPYAVSALGDDVLLYASDFPHLNPEKILHEKEHFLARPDLSDTTKAKIMGRNALRLYNLAPK
jgi:predicted TIM-barrel fold metal-dependent hydrolase